MTNTPLKKKYLTVRKIETPTGKIEDVVLPRSPTPYIGDIQLAYDEYEEAYEKAKISGLDEHWADAIVKFTWLRILIEEFLLRCNYNRISPPRRRDTIYDAKWIGNSPIAAMCAEMWREFDEEHAPDFESVLPDKYKKEIEVCFEMAQDAVIKFGKLFFAVCAISDYLREITAENES